jgi:hypothetical protein
VRQTLAVVDWLSRTDAAPSPGGPGSGGRVGTVLAWVVGIAIVVALGLLLVDLVRDAGTLQSDLSGESAGVEAAGRITTVLATGDLAPPAGVSVAMTPECESGSGSPALVLTYTPPSGEPSPADAVTASLHDRGWASVPFGAPAVRKRFGDWAATASLPDSSSTPSVVTLTVQGDIDADCRTFLDQLSPVLRLAGT